MTSAGREVTLLGDFRRDQRGVTLVELLVVIVILGVVGGIAFAGVLSALQSSRHTGERIDATQELEIALQRIARDVRGASQQLVITEDAPDNVDLQGFDADDPEYYGFDLGVNLVEDLDEQDNPVTTRVTYVLSFPDVDEDGDTPARLIRQREDSGDQTLVTLVDVDVTEPVFRYLDVRGNPIECTTDGECGKDLAEASQLEIVLTRNLQGRAESIVTARTRVFIRNIRYEESG